MRGHDRGLEGGEEGGADPRPPGSARAINGVGRRVRWILSHLGSTHAITGGDARFGAQGRGRAGGGRRCQGGGTVDPRMAGGQGGRWGGWRGPGRVDPRMPEAPGRAVGRMVGVAGVDRRGRIVRHIPLWTPTIGS
jgi:hypothetical protein